MVGRVGVSVVVVLVGCSEPARRAVTKPAPPATPPVAVAAAAAVAAPQPTTVKYVIKTGPKVTGALELTTAPDGTIATTGKNVNNGRGPATDSTQRYAADGTLLSYHATGHYMMGETFDETFTIDDKVARWKTGVQSAEQPMTGPAMFVPNAWAPEIIPAIVRAARSHGDTISILPSGQARVPKLQDHAVTIDGTTKQLTLFAIDGLTQSPVYTWLDDRGAWFGNVSLGPSTVPVGWDGSIKELVDVQMALETGRVGEIYARNAHPIPAAGLAYTHARVLDVTKGRWMPDQTVVIVGDTITAVGPAKTTKVPAGAEVVDLAGKALLPGLMDMHSHLSNSGGVLDIASGVTTVREVGNRLAFLPDLIQRVDAGKAVGPTIIPFGMIEGVGEKALAADVTATTPEEATTAVEKYAAMKYAGIKIYNSIKPDLVPVMAKLAHAKGMKVTGHVPAFMLAEDAINAGYDSIEHINQVMLNFVGTHETDSRDLLRFTLVGEKGATLDLASQRVKDFIALLRKKKVVIDPTLSVFENLFVANESGKPLPDQARVVMRLPAMEQREILKMALPALREHADQYRASWQRMLELVKALHDAKVPIATGTDMTQGLWLHHELKLLASAGISNADVLALATIGNARTLGLEKTLGSITKGKKADLFVVDGDPLADIGQIERVVGTMRRGVVFQSAALYEAVGVKPWAP